MSFYELVSPVTAAELERLDGALRVIQFASALSDADYRLLSEWLRERPGITLRVYGSYDGSIANLDFLRWFPNLKRFRVDIYRLDSIDGLECLPDGVEVLGLGATKKRFSLKSIGRFRELRALFLEGHTKDIEVLSDLRAITDLTLRSITLSGLELLRPMNRLRALDIKLGGTTNIAALPTLGPIQYLEFWQVRGLSDLSPIADMTDLEFLFLQSLRRVEKLPSFENSRRLKRIWLETMKGLSDVSTAAAAPALEHLAVVDMGQLEPEALRPLAARPSLKSVFAALGSAKKNNRAREILGSLASDRDWTNWDASSYHHQ